MIRTAVKALLALALAGALPIAAPAAAQRAVDAVSPAIPGSAQRRAILDAVRPAIQRRLGPNIEFVVRRIGVESGWALVIAEPQRRGGGRIDPARYFPREDLDFMDGLTVNAVLRFRGGRWVLVDHAIGPTDVWYCGLEGLPPSLTGC